MIFTTLDLHTHFNGSLSTKPHRDFRLMINHIVDSFSVRIPKKTRTLLFHKLNIQVSPAPTQRNEFHSIEGYASAEIIDPSIASIYGETRQEAVNRSIGYLLQGVRLAAKYDHLFAQSLPLWEHMLSESQLEYDYYCGISRSQKSRRLKAEAIIRITPLAYHYQVLVKNSKTEEIVQRFTVDTTECLWPHFRGLGFSKLRWEADSLIIGLTNDDKEVFRFKVENE